MLLGLHRFPAWSTASTRRRRRSARPTRRWLPPNRPPRPGRRHVLPPRPPRSPIHRSPTPPCMAHPVLRQQRTRPSAICNAPAFYRRKNDLPLEEEHRVPPSDTPRSSPAIQRTTAILPMLHSPHSRAMTGFAARPNSPITSALPAPALYADPAVRFAETTAQRELGFANPAQRYFITLHSLPESDPWRECSAAEEWLARPDEQPPTKKIASCRVTDPATRPRRQPRRTLLESSRSHATRHRPLAAWRQL